MDRDAVRAWVVSRLAVVVLLAGTTYAQTHHGYGRPPVRSGSTGFFAWDAGWYRDIAAYGYGAVGHAGLRFFPLLPLTGRAVSVLGAFAAGLVVLVVANLSALAYADGLVRLTAYEVGERGAARRAAWLALLNPAAFVLVLAYAEATAAALAVWVLFALRRRRWLLAAVLAFLCGLARPTGLLIALPAAIEAARGWRAVSSRETARRALAVVAAPAGCLAYLVWCGIARHDALGPFREQQAADLRGGVVVWPGKALAFAWHEFVLAGSVRVALHLVWVPVVVALLVLAWRRLPASYTAYAAVIAVLAVGTPKLASVERYSMSAFPLLMAAATIRARPLRVLLAVACGVGFAAYAVLAFANVYVP
ncbi:MAG: hypothetical protein QOE45_2457 [Frankiaceae bacterium]|nr:hypothetical protein [Frankiaceae bacterium]